MSSKLSAVVEFFLIFSVISNKMHLVTAKSGWVYKNEVEAKICYNPNNNLGFCVPLKECASFNYVLRHKLQANFRFFWASQCERETGNPPFICCTRDRQFKQQRVEKTGKADRIIFPDEAEKCKKSGGNSESTSQRIEPVSEISTERTILQKVNSTESMQTTKSTPNSESPEILAPFKINKTDYFPKPPKCGGIVLANKIYGGQDADLSEFSWMVILEFRNQTTGKLLMDCAGSLISNRYVLTAAHCVQGEILRSIGKLESVRIGDHNTETETDCDNMGCRQPFQRIGIELIIPHANFSFKGILGTQNQHDIALIRLKESIKFNDILQPVCLPNVVELQELKEPTTLVVAGWGHNGTMVRTAIKQKLELPLVSHEKCRKTYGKKFFLADEQICAGGNFRQDSCNGDSGGPLMRINKDFWVLEGIVSFGLKCGLEQPGIYTNVRHYIDWINANVETD